MKVTYIDVEIQTLTLVYYRDNRKENPRVNPTRWTRGPTTIPIPPQGKVGTPSGTITSCRRRERHGRGKNGGETQVGRPRVTLPRLDFEKKTPADPLPTRLSERTDTPDVHRKDE